MAMNSQKIKVAVSVVALVVAVALVVFQLSGRQPDIGDLASSAPAICSETGEVFERFVAPREAQPWTNPKTDKRTLWPAERCFYTKDGKVKSKPTFVFLKAWLGEKGETICPDCGRRVVLRNPAPKGEDIEAAKKEGR